MKLLLAFAAGFVSALAVTSHRAHHVRTYYDELHKVKNPSTRFLH